MSIQDTQNDGVLPYASITALVALILGCSALTFQSSTIALLVAGVLVTFLVLTWTSRAYGVPRAALWPLLWAVVVLGSFAVSHQWSETTVSVMWWWMTVFIIGVVSSWAVAKNFLPVVTRSLIAVQVILALSGAFDVLRYHVRAAGFPTNANGLGAALLWGVTMLIVLILAGIRRKWTIPLLVIVALPFLLTFSLTSFVALLIPLGWMIWLYRMNIHWKKTAIVLVLLGGIGAATWMFGPARLRSFMTSQHVTSSYSQRLEFTRVAFKMWQEKPWFGWGVGTYQKIFPRFTNQFAEQPLYAHNLFAQLLAETGAVGGLAWVSLVVFIGLRGWRWMRQRTTHQILAQGLWFGWLAFTLAAAVDFGWFFTAGWIWWCIASGAFLSSHQAMSARGVMTSRLLGVIVSLVAVVYVGRYGLALQASAHGRHQSDVTDLSGSRSSMHRAVSLGSGLNDTVFYAQQLWSDRRPGDVQQAEQLIRRALVHNGDDYNLHTMLGYILMTKKDWNGSTEEFRIALRQNSWFHPTYYVNLARALFDSGKKVEAFEVFDRAFKQYGKNPGQGNTIVAKEYLVVQQYYRQLSGGL